jgi:hypothetical protein
MSQARQKFRTVREGGPDPTTPHGDRIRRWKKGPTCPFAHDNCKLVRADPGVEIKRSDGVRLDCLPPPMASS